MADAHRELGHTAVILSGPVTRGAQPLSVAARQRVRGDAVQDGAEHDGEGDRRLRSPATGSPSPTTIRA